MATRRLHRGRRSLVLKEILGSFGDLEDGLFIEFRSGFLGCFLFSAML